MPLTDEAVVLAQLDAIGIGADLDRPADGLARTSLLSKRTRQVFDGDAGTEWKPSKGPA